MYSFFFIMRNGKIFNFFFVLILLGKKGIKRVFFEFLSRLEDFNSSNKVYISKDGRIKFLFVRITRNRFRN